MDTTSTSTCDRCGPTVRARFLASLPSGRVLTLCGHHATEYRPKLTEQGAFIYEIAQP